MPPFGKAPVDVRLALYCRVSTANKGQDIGLQLDDLRNAARQRGWTVVEEYLDRGESGAKDSRPALDQMMKDARAGRFNTLMVWRFDRLFRSTVHLLQSLQTFSALNINFVSLHENVDTGSAAGRVLFTLIAAIGEFERALIMERTAAGVARARARGKKFGRPIRADLDMDRIARLRHNGQSVAAISRLMEIPESTIRSALNRIREKSPRERAASGSASP